MKVIQKHMDLVLWIWILLSGGTLVFFGWNLARSIWAVDKVSNVEPLSKAEARSLDIPTMKPREHYEVIVRRNIFSLGDQEARGAKPQKASPQAPVETPLNVRLKGTAVSPGGMALAMIEDSTQRKEDLYVVGDRIQDAQIVKILPDHVILQRGGREEKLSLFVEGGPKGSRTAPSPQAQAAKQPAPGHQAPQPTRQQVLQTLMAKLRLRPHMQDGKPQGFVIGDVPGGSVFEAAGLKVGDILVGINNEEVRTPNQLLKAYKDASEARELLLDILREGQNVKVEVDIETALQGQ